MNWYHVFDDVDKTVQGSNDDKNWTIKCFKMTSVEDVKTVMKQKFY